MGVREAGIQRFTNEDKAGSKIRDSGEKRLRDRRPHIEEYRRWEPSQDGEQNPVLPLPQHDHYARGALPQPPPAEGGDFWNSQIVFGHTCTLISNLISFFSFRF